MTYASGNQILDSDYNGFINQVNPVFGVGAGDSGYGNSPILASAAAGTPITATQWASLLSRISTMASHQGTTLSSISTPTVGVPISAHAQLTSNITGVVNSRRNAIASGTDITTGGVGQRTTGWVNSVTMQYTITFTTANAARHFFNAGGMIRMNFSRSGGVAHAKNADWTALCTACGTVVVTGGGHASIAGTPYSGTNKLGGSGSPTTLLLTTGYHQLAAGYQTLFVQRSTNPIYGGYSLYSANRIEVRALRNANTVLVQVVFIDDAPDTSPVPLDIVDGTLQTTMILRPPSTTHLTNSWGTPSMSVTVSGS